MRTHTFFLLLLLLPLGGCTHLIFQPMKTHVLDPAEVNIEARDVYFQTTDGLRLHGWFLPSQTPAKGTLLFLHGNAENVSTHIGSVWWLPRYGYNVFLFDYRGYGHSEGTPTLPGVHEDMESALRTVLRMEEVDKQRLIVFGQSLGGAIAVTGLADSAYRDQVRALVIESAPSSFRTVAREALDKWWITWLFQWPLSLTISDDYQPLQRIGENSPIPVLIIHGTSDSIIAPRHAADLYDAAKSPKTLWMVEGVGHIAAMTEQVNRERLAEYLDRVLETGAFE